MDFVSRSARFAVGKSKLKKKRGIEVWRDSKIQPRNHIHAYPISTHAMALCTASFIRKKVGRMRRIIVSEGPVNSGGV